VPNPRCVSLTQRGVRCKRPAVQGSQLCGLHLNDTSTVYSDELAERLIAMLRAGNTVIAATSAVGISRQSFGTWMRRGARGEHPFRLFRERVEQARAEAEVRHVTQIAAAAGSDWRAASWMLERQLRREQRPPVDTDALAQQVRDDAYQEAHATLEAIGEPPELNTGAIDRYAAAMVVWQTLEAEWERDGRPGTALGGATGSAEVPHPLITQIAGARREAAILGAALGLDPRGRQKLSRRVGAGRPPGAASAADRAAPPRRRLRAV
jgi:phage terminase small subunit